MNYALVEDGQVVSTNLPRIGTLPNGSKVSGFDKLDAETLKSAGWLPVVDDGPPEYDSDVEGVTRLLEVGEDEVNVVYTVYELPPVPPLEPLPPTDLERVQAKNDQLQALADSLLTDMLMVYDILILNGLI